MSRKVRVLVFAAGLVILALLVREAGPRALAAGARRVGWYVVPIVLVYLPVYLLNAAAWRLTMPGGRAAAGRPSYVRTLAFLVSGFALNYLTPVLALGGEPYRVAAISPWLGRRRAVASVASYFLLHALTNVLIWLTALVIALVATPWPLAVRGAIAVVAAVLLALVALVFRALRRGVFEDLFAVAAHVPLLRRVATRARGRRAALRRIDSHMAAFHATGPVRFFGALGLEYVARTISMAEFWLIFLALGLHVDFLHAFMMGALTSLSMNIVFFVPLEIGMKEGSLYALAAALALPAGSGLLASLISRVREVVWAAIGVALVPLAGHGTGISHTAKGRRLRGWKAGRLRG